MQSDLRLTAQSLEDAFFYEQDQRLLESLREMKTLEATTGLLSEVSGLSDPSLLIDLARLAITPASAASLAILPLVAVAWVDGRVDAVERQALVETLDQTFFFQTIDRDILDAWLTMPPPETLVAAWEAFARDLVFQLSPAARRALAETVLGNAKTVATAVGRFLGFGGISPQEQALLDRLGRALRHD